MRASYRAVIAALRSLRSPRNIEGMRLFGVRGRNLLGVPLPRLERMARAAGKDHALALRLWDSGLHEARILAAMVDEPEKVGAAQMEKWVKGFDSWDLCDQVCGRLFDRTPFAAAKAKGWSRRKGEFEKRAGFVLMAGLAVHDKDAPDGLFLGFLPILRRESGDGRNFVKKAVNWALRQIGKRNRRLHRVALAEAGRIGKRGVPAARWIAADALRELKSCRVRNYGQG